MNAPVLAQTGIGGLVGYSRNDHWYRSNVGLGVSAERAFRTERWSLRASLFGHLPVNGRHVGAFNGHPQPVSFGLGTEENTHDRYWSVAFDVEPQVRLGFIGTSALQVRTLVGLGYHHEHYDYVSRENDPRSRSIVEREGTLLRDRWAQRTGVELRYGVRPSQVFLGLVWDTVAYVAAGPPKEQLTWFEEYSLRFGFVHTLNSKHQRS